MLIHSCLRLCRGPLLAAAVLLLPAWSPAQPLAPPPEFNPYNRFVGYPTSAYAGYAVYGLPTYMTSINYPTIYGQWTVGTMWAGSYMSDAIKAPYSLYPTSTYSPVAPPAAAGFSQLYYNTGPGGAPLPGQPATSTLTAASQAAPATIDVFLPADAELTVQGKRMTQTGPTRTVVTPFLNPAFAYSYDIVATWNENGHPVTQTRRIIVRPGDRDSVTFTETPPAPASPTLRTR